MTVEEYTFSKYAGKPVLVDSNLLLLFMVGSFDQELIVRFKRTARYSVRHYELLVRILGYFSGVVATPHILTEVSNLANSLPEWMKLEWFAHFSAQIPNLEERFRDTESLRLESGFLPFGLTDSALQHVASTTLLLTDDRRLAGYLVSVGIAVLNFDDLFQISRSLAD